MTHQKKLRALGAAAIFTAALGLLAAIDLQTAEASAESNVETPRAANEAQKTPAQKTPPKPAPKKIGRLRKILPTHSMGGY